ncbi:MAG: EAL domain-containing protein [Actinomycetota bacterium]|nr:EAL domain-containing protein [Actinomycetota bacterium]
MTCIAEGHDLYCSINVSGRQVSEPGFTREIIDVVRASGADPRAMVIELTESVLAAFGASQVFDELHSEGFRIALDDFGTGYSALQYLQSFDIDLIKIDRSFVTALGETKNGTVVQAVLNMATNIGAQTLAEGIENPEELRLLRELGIELGQGYYFSKPIPEAELSELLAENGTANHHSVRSAKGQ